MGGYKISKRTNLGEVSGWEGLEVSFLLFLILDIFCTFTLRSQQMCCLDCETAETYAREMGWPGVGPAAPPIAAAPSAHAPTRTVDGGTKKKKEWKSKLFSDKELKKVDKYQYRENDGDDGPRFVPGHVLDEFEQIQRRTPPRPPPRVVDMIESVETQETQQKPSSHPIYQNGDDSSFARPLPLGQQTPSSIVTTVGTPPRPQRCTRRDHIWEGCFNSTFVNNGCLTDRFCDGCGVPFMGRKRMPEEVPGESGIWLSMTNEACHCTQCFFAMCRKCRMTWDAGTPKRGKEDEDGAPGE
jgi:hypothetical protein